MTLNVGHITNIFQRPTSTYILELTEFSDVQ